MNQRVAVGIAAAALAAGVAGSAGIAGYMIGHHNTAPVAAEWHLDPSDIERAIDVYRQQQWEATKRQVMQSDVSANDNLLTPRRAASTRRDLTNQQRGELNHLQAQLDDIQARIDAMGGYR